MIVRDFESRRKFLNVSNSLENECNEEGEYVLVFYLDGYVGGVLITCHSNPSG